MAHYRLTTLSYSECVTDCPGNGTFNNATTLTCDLCDKNVCFDGVSNKICQGKATTCQQCKFGYKQDTTQVYSPCIADCPNGFYKLSTLNN